MENIDLLFEKNCNQLHKIKIKNKKLILDYSQYMNKNLFHGEIIKKIIDDINSLKKQYPNLKVPIEFRFGFTSFIDKLSYVMLECICYYLISVRKQYVQIYMKVSKDIGTEGIESSPLLLLNNTSKETTKKFPEKFERDIFRNHFRRVIKSNKTNEKNYLGRLMEEVNSFLKPFNVDEESRDEISLVISELAGNAGEHACSDCLIDIDVTDSYKKRNDEKRKYIGVNIIVVNFSDIILGKGIKDNILNSIVKIEDERYKVVYDAYNFHKNKFDESYLDEDFANITAFQHRISGREMYSKTGGTGLTKLIKSLEEKSDTYRCYMITGRRSVNFEHDCLIYNKDGWLGFNTTGCYAEDVPSEGIVTEGLIYMPGTAYNLNFVLKGE